MSERTAIHGLFRGISATVNRTRAYVYRSDSFGQHPPRPGSVIGYHQGTGDGRGEDRLGAWWCYRHHGVVVASGQGEEYDAEASIRTGAEVWRRIVWAEIRPATMPEALGHATEERRR